MAVVVVVSWSVIVTKPLLLMSPVIPAPSVGQSYDQQIVLAKGLSVCLSLSTHTHARTHTYIRH